MLTRLLRWATGAAVVAAVAALGAAPAVAHANLVSSQPPPGGTIAGGQSLSLRFSEPVEPARSSVTLTEPGGTTVPLGPLTATDAAGTTVTVTIPSSVTAAAWSVQWQATAVDDGHVTSGAFPVHVSAATAAVEVAATATARKPGHRPARPWGVKGALALARLVCYLGLIVLCGGLAFLALAWPAGADVVRTRVVLWTAWAAAAAGTVAGLGLQGASAAGRGLSAVLDVHLLADTVRTHVGQVEAARALLLVLAVVVLAAVSADGAAAVRTPAWKVGAAAAGIALLRTPGLAGHASEGRDAWIGSVADLVHLTGAALWIGGLVLVCAVVLPRRRPDELRLVMPRYSTIAFVAVSAVAVAGLFMSWQLVGGFGALVTTSFGRLLLIKLTAFAAVLLVARGSKHWVDRRLDLAVLTGGHRAAVRPFVYSVAVEVALALTVVFVATLLVATNPAR